MNHDAIGKEAKSIKSLLDMFNDEVSSPSAQHALKTLADEVGKLVASAKRCRILVMQACCRLIGQGLGLGPGHEPRGK